jgi:hypothetical protein
MLSRAVKTVISSIVLGVSLLATPCEAKTLKENFDTESNYIYAGITPFRLKDFDDISFPSGVADDYTFYLGIPNNDEIKGKTTHGLHLRSRKQIHIFNNLKSDAHVYTVLYHELGHALDYSYEPVSATSGITLYSQTEEFLACSDEARNLKAYTIDCNFNTRGREYFAECVALYKLRPDIMKSNAPRTYAFIDSIFVSKA